ncbi:MAG: SAM-dependent methyltransferase [Cyclobacteriaceae bacterium]
MNSKGILYLIPNVLSPDTALKVIAPAVKEVISQTSYFLVEDLRTARRYISSLKLGVDLEKVRMEVLDKKTPAHEVEKLMEPVLRGENAGIVSDAGCPGIADPGAMAVAYAQKKDIQVVPLAGPSSMFLALMGSGLNGQSFSFGGYLPIDRKERIAAIKSLEEQSKRNNSTQMFMETPFRNRKLMEDLLHHLQPETLLCVASNLTGQGEFLKTKRVLDWRKSVPNLHKIPTVFLLLVER